MINQKSRLTFSCAEYKFIVPTAERAGPGEVHSGLGDVGVPKRERHRLDWLDLFPVIGRYQFP